MNPHFSKTICFERNPLRDKLEGKIRTLNNYQTLRTAREFRQTIEESFNTFGINPRRKLFRDSLYSIYFYDEPLDQLEMLGITFGKRESVAHYVIADKKMNITQSITSKEIFAYRIPSLRKDIILGREEPLGMAPISVEIQGKTYEIKYPHSPSLFGGIKPA